MDTNRVRKLLEDCFTQGRETCDGAFCTGCWKDNVRAALAELDKTPKVLTAEPVAWMLKREDPLAPSLFTKREVMRRVELRRNKEEEFIPLYLAPAAGLTVDEMMEVANRLPFKWDNGGAYVYISALRSRLTAAIEAKR